MQGGAQNHDLGRRPRIRYQWLSRHGSSGQLNIHVAVLGALVIDVVRGGPAVQFAGKLFQASVPFARTVPLHEFDSPVRVLSRFRAAVMVGHSAGTAKSRCMMMPPMGSRVSSRHRK